MTKIALIGAGSLVFTRSLCSDLLLVPELADCHIALMDVDAGRLEMARQGVQALIDRRGLDRARVTAHLDRREAVRGAGIVITTFQQGMLEAYRLDIEIPRKYGVEQCVGDTLGPGGVFRGLRTVPVLLDLCRELEALAPEALLLNYVNPMAICCQAVSKGTGRPVLGLCHSVQETGRMLAGWLGVPYPELSFLCAGINHQAWFLELSHAGRDLYPPLRQAVERPDLAGLEPVRIDLFKHFGYFVTESSGHASEYVPYYRKNARLIEQELVPRFKNKDHSGWYDFGRTGGYLRSCEWLAGHFQEAYQGLLDPGQPIPDERTHEYGSYIIEALETGRPVEVNANVPNQGLIDNLPIDCCVEVPCQIDSRGAHPQAVGRLPAQLAALNMACVQVQELVVQAALTGDREAVYHALMLDPLTAAACTLPQIEALTTEMLEAQSCWLPF